MLFIFIRFVGLFVLAFGYLYASNSLLYKKIYQISQSNNLFVDSVVEKKVLNSLRFQIKARVAIKLQGDFDDFMGFLEDMAENDWALASKIHIKSGPRCHFYVELERHASCQERFPASARATDEQASF